MGVGRSALLPTIGQIIGAGAVVSIVAYLLGGRLLALGVIAGIPLSAFNYYLVSSAVESTVAGTAKAQTFFLRRFLYRTLITFAALFISLAGGIRFMLGMAVGLSLQVLVHIIQSIFVILNGKG